MCEEAIHSLNSSSLASRYGVNALFADGKRQFHTSSRCNERENKGKYISRSTGKNDARINHFALHRWNGHAWYLRLVSTVFDGWYPSLAIQATVRTSIVPLAVVCVPVRKVRQRRKWTFFFVFFFRKYNGMIVEWSTYRQERSFERRLLSYFSRSFNFDRRRIRERVTYH